MSECREVLMRREARYVLWVLRCAIRAAQGDEEAADHLGEQPETAAVTLGCEPFIRLIRALGDGTGIDWHDPACGCVSSGEMALLHALATPADGELPSGSWWSMILGSGRFEEARRAAADWLRCLDAAGLRFPRADALLAGVIEPIGNLVEVPAPARLQ